MRSLVIACCFLMLPLLAQAKEAPGLDPEMSEESATALDNEPSVQVKLEDVILPCGLTIPQYRDFEEWARKKGGKLKFYPAICDYKDLLLQHYRAGDVELKNPSIVSHAEERHFVDNSDGLTYQEREEFRKNHDGFFLFRWSSDRMLPNGLTVGEYSEFEQARDYGRKQDTKFYQNICAFKDYLVRHYRVGDYKRERDLHWSYPH